LLFIRRTVLITEISAAVNRKYVAVSGTSGARMDVSIKGEGVVYTLRLDSVNF
jgi:hypothetical protein